MNGNLIQIQLVKFESRTFSSIYDHVAVFGYFSATVLLQILIHRLTFLPMNCCRSPINLLDFPCYASSGWCLDELVLILEQRKRTCSYVVLPLFHDVDPSEVRAQVGSFAEAFALHEQKFMAETNANKNKGKCKLEGWRAAVTEVANLAGMVLPNEADGSINDWLQDQSTGIVAIYRIGGMGKTTIAKFLYNLSFKKFDGSSFLANVREFSERSDGLVRLQKQLLSDILPEREVEIYNIHEGIVKIKDALHGKRTFIVDDLDHRCQLDALFDTQDWFCPGSQIMLTTRHKRLLKAHEVYEKHKVEKLCDDQSPELFSWHAFGQNHPIQGYMEHSWKVIRYCKGLPLAIEVLGSSLNGHSVDIWESALEKLKNVPDSGIFETLKISFDSLQDDHDKDLLTTTIEGLCVNLKHIPDKPSTLYPPGYFSGLSTYLSLTKSFSASDQMDFETDAFAGMHKLRLLQLNNINARLLGTPSCIERLILAYCTNLIGIHESIGELHWLNFLDLVGYVNLEKLPRSIDRLKSLEKLILFGCSKLFNVPAEMSKMECLAIDNINRSPSSTAAGKMKTLGSSAWSLIWKPRKPPQPIGFSLAFLAHSLLFLSVVNCNITDDAFPRDFGDTTWLCHWEMKNQLEGGDELQILVHLQAGTQLKKFGIQVVYEQQVKEHYIEDLKLVRHVDCGSNACFQIVPRCFGMKESYRRQGIGEALLKASIEKCRSRNVHRVPLHEDEDPSRISDANLYKKLSFHVDNLIEGYYCLDRNAYRMYFDFLTD
ncbi:hypothetical protein LguiA_018958 [Lonicera macranthoides]